VLLIDGGARFGNRAQARSQPQSIEQFETNVVRIVVTKKKGRKKEDAMNWEETKGRWNQMKGAVKKQWGKLTDDDLAIIAGQRDQLLGKIQERYGIAKEEADKQVKTWESTRLDETKDLESEQKRKAS
jgi:uncharacterized protein YjbJ (UPF0337 family)